MNKLQTGPDQFVEILPETNANLVLNWCNGNHDRASAAVRLTPYRFVLWYCDADEKTLARTLREADLFHLVPPGINLN